MIPRQSSYGCESPHWCRWPDYPSREYGLRAQPRFFAFPSHVLDQAYEQSPVYGADEKVVAADEVHHLAQIASRHAIARLGQDDDHDIRVAGLAADAGAELEAVEIGKGKVHDKNVGRVGSTSLQDIAPTGCSLDVKSAAFKLA